MADTTNTTSSQERAAPSGFSLPAVGGASVSLEDILDGVTAGAPAPKGNPKADKATRATSAKTTEAEGDETEGDEAEGDETEGDEAEGDETEGDETEGDETEGDETEGDETEGDETEGDETEGDETEGDETEGDETEGDEAEGDDETPAPKGLEALPKWAQKRVQKQSADIRALRAELAQASTRGTPTADNPLAHITNKKELADTLAEAKAVRTQFGKLKAADYTEDDDGNAVYTVKEGNTTTTLTQAQIEGMLAEAETVLDPEAIRGRETFLSQRDTAKPWEEAERLVPGMLTPGTTPNKIYRQIVQAVPALQSSLYNHETLVAHAIANLMRLQDTAPSQEFPQGKAKWVRYALDAKGAVLPPKRADKPTPGKGGAKAAAVAAPNTARPGTKPGAAARNAATRAIKPGQSVDLESWLDAEN